MAAANFSFTTGASGTPDTTPPAIVSRSPTSGTAGLPVNTQLTYTTSERINAAAVGPASAPVYAVIAGVGTIQLAGVYTVSPAGTVVTFTVTGAFPANATIQWYTNYNSSIRDMAGLLLPNQFAQYTTANTPDVTGPIVQTVTPSNGSTGVGPNTTVTLTFSEVGEPEHREQHSVALFAGSTRLSPSLTRSLDNRMVLLATTLPPEDDDHRRRDERRHGPLRECAGDVHQHVHDAPGRSTRRVRRSSRSARREAASRQRRRSRCS